METEIKNFIMLGKSSVLVHSFVIMSSVELFVNII